ncbi:MAG: hypothetical protein PF482_11710 [Desulfobacteraceae bacterium]|nr:hypothetical protein [Desulfobacteraceae bacterium]
MAKIKIDKNLLGRAKQVAETAGYRTVEYFVSHIIEKEITRYESDSDDGKVAERLRGLGYIE